MMPLVFKWVQAAIVTKLNSLERRKRREYSITEERVQQLQQDCNSLSLGQKKEVKNDNKRKESVESCEREILSFVESKMALLIALK